jgi:steroid 5-alpha reductase family enzyme
MSFEIALLLLLVQSVALSAIMSFAWIVQQKTGNCGWIDAVWTFGLMAIGVVSALWPLSESNAPSQRQILVACLVAIWGLRLGIYIVQRSASKADDPRYAKLIAEWGQDANRQMYILLQKQALVSIPLAFSIAIAAHNPAPGRDSQDAVAVIIFAIGLIGGAVADRQLGTFIKQPGNQGQLCNVGLWRYSRHPNYFFEWLLWVSYAVFAINLSGAYPWGWLALIAPAMIYWLLVYVSGVPPLEEHMIRRRGETYRRYQETTNMFFPGPARAIDDKANS